MSTALWGVLGVAALVLAALGYLMRGASTGPRLVREGRVVGIVGRKGHGKTLFAVHELLRSLGVKQRCHKCSREMGRRVTHPVHIASNLTIDVPEKHRDLFHRIDGWDDIVGVVRGDDGQDRYVFLLPHCTLIMLDEAHLFAPAKQGEQLPEAVRWYLSMLRHDVQELIWVTQHESRVSLGLRLQTDELGLCRKGLLRQMSVRFFEPENFRKMGARPDWTFRYRVTKKLAAAYDTYAMLQPDQSSEGIRNGELGVSKRASTTRARSRESMS